MRLLQKCCTCRSPYQRKSRQVQVFCKSLPGQEVSHPPGMSGCDFPQHPEPTEEPLDEIARRNLPMVERPWLRAVARGGDNGCRSDAGEWSRMALLPHPCSAITVMPVSMSTSSVSAAVQSAARSGAMIRAPGTCSHPRQQVFECSIHSSYSGDSSPRTRWSDATQANGRGAD